MKQLIFLCLFPCFFACTSSQPHARVTATLNKHSPLLLDVDLSEFSLHISCVGDSGVVAGPVNSSGDVYTIEAVLPVCQHAQARLDIKLTTPLGVVALAGQTDALLVGDVDATFVVDRVGEVDLVGAPGVKCTSAEGEVVTVPGRLVLTVGTHTLSCEGGGQTFTAEAVVQLGKRSTLDVHVQPVDVAQLVLVSSAVVNVVAGAQVAPFLYELRTASGALAPIDAATVELLQDNQVITSSQTMAGAALLQLAPMGAVGSYAFVASASINGRTLLAPPVTLNVLAGLAAKLNITNPASAAVGVPVAFHVGVTDNFGNVPSDLTGMLTIEVAPLTSNLPSPQLSSLGDASFELTFLDAAPHTVTVKYGAATGSSGIDVLAFDQPTALVMLIAPSGTAGQSIAVTLEARNASNLKVVTFNQTGGLLSSSDATFAAQPFSISAGAASSLIVLKTAGNITVSAALAPFNVQQQVSVGPAAASQVVLQMPTLFSACVPQTVHAYTTDQYGNPVIPFSGTITLHTQDPITGALSGGEINQGVVFTTSTTAPLNVFADTVPATTQVNVSVNVLAGTISALELTSQPANTNAGMALSPGLRAELRNQCGGHESVGGKPLSVAIGANPGLSALVGTTGLLTDATGGATFGDLKIANPAVGYTLVASGSGPSGPITIESKAFDVLGGLVLFVSAGASGPSFLGTSTDPFIDIGQGILAASGPHEVRVAEGLYTNTLTLDQDVKVTGGWSSDFAVLDPALHVTVLRPTTGTGVSFSSGSSAGTAISGFFIDGSQATGIFTGVEFNVMGVGSVLSSRIAPGSGSSLFSRVGVHVSAGAGGATIANSLIHSGVFAVTGGGAGIWAESTALTRIVNNTIFVETGDDGLRVSGASVNVAGNIIAGALDCPNSTCAFRHTGVAPWSLQANAVFHCGTLASVVGVDGVTGVTNMDALDGAGLAFDANVYADSATPGCDLVNYGLNNAGGSDSQPSTLNLGASGDTLQDWRTPLGLAGITLDTTGNQCGPTVNAACGGPPTDIVGAARAVTFRAGAYAN